MNSDNFNERLKQLRTNKGLTIKELALTANIPYNTYTKYENGKITPTAPVIIAIAKALQISTDELLGYSLDNDPLAQIKRELQDIGLYLGYDNEFNICVFDDESQECFELNDVSDIYNQISYGLKYAKIESRKPLINAFWVGLLKYEHLKSDKHEYLKTADKQMQQPKEKKPVKFSWKKFIDSLSVQEDNTDKEKAPASEPTADKG